MMTVYSWYSYKFTNLKIHFYHLKTPIKYDNSPNIKRRVTSKRPISVGVRTVIDFLSVTRMRQGYAVYVMSEILILFFNMTVKCVKN